MSELLRVEALEAAYGSVRALRGVDLEVRSGELVALVGSNGAGKSTLLRTLSGVHPALAGRVLYRGADVTRAPVHERVAGGIILVPEGRQVFGILTVEDNLRLGAHTRPRQEMDDGLDRVFRLFPVLAERRRQRAGTLSGGEQQMLAIGRGLMGRPTLLLLDEPSMGLAPRLVAALFEVIVSLRAGGVTMLLVEQNAHAALSIADRGYVLETGRITLEGPGPELLGAEAVRAAYLGIQKESA
ncbi:MAG TPA: ABC transporter ATP-binding protein [Gemmatimonadales bacterium]|jgi:branched-chain amino acid transport system ATP-binding protein|nr:ABC transporter ATP-binding protein [Gemmatimonadales bacterium]